MGYFAYETIKIFQYIYEDIEEWNSYQKSDKSKHMFRNKENKQCKEYRKFHIRRDYFRIEIIRLHRMNKGYHTSNCHYNARTTVIVSDDKNRYGRKEGTENRNKSEYKYNHSESDNIRKGFSAMEKTHNKKSNNRQYGICKGNYRLCFKDKSKSFCNLTKNNSILFIQERKIPSFHGFEIICYFCSVYKEYITQDERYKELR